MAKSGYIIGFIGLFLVSAGAAHGSNLVKCVAIKRGIQASGLAERGLRIAELDFDGLSKTLWFGKNQALRDQALEMCQTRVSRYECRHDGPSHISYGRGGVSVKTTAWALHELDHGVRDTFSDPPFAFMESASEQCYAELIDRVVDQLEKRFSL